MSDKLTDEQIKEKAKQDMLDKKYRRLVNTDLYKTIEKRGFANDRGDKYAITTDTLKKMFEAFIIGCTDMEVCLNAEISPATLYNFQIEFPELLELKRAWKYNPILQARNSVFQGVKKTKNAKWILEHSELSRGEFSKNTNVTLLPSDGVIEGDKLNTLEHLLKEITNGTQKPNSNTGANAGDSASSDNPKK